MASTVCCYGLYGFYSQFLWLIKAGLDRGGFTIIFSIGRINIDIG